MRCLLFLHKTNAQADHLLARTKVEAGMVSNRLFRVAGSRKPAGRRNMRRLAVACWPAHDRGTGAERDEHYLHPVVHVALRHPTGVPNKKELALQIMVCGASCQSAGVLE